MPYPIANLAYGLRCRLSDLSTPVERYSLQIAAGDASICPPKLQIVQENLQHLSFGCRNETVFAYRDAYYNAYHDVSTPIQWVEDDIFIYAGQNMTLYDLTAEALKSDVFDHFVSNAHSILILNCHFSKPFFKMVKLLFQKTVFLEIIDYMSISNINFTELLTALPNVQSISSNRCHNANWISEILQVKKHSLMKLSLGYDSFEQTDEFDNELLLTFLKAQHPGFELSLSIPIPMKEMPFIGKLLKFLNRKLVRGYGPGVTQCDSRIKQTHTTLRICSIKLDRTYYLPLNGDNVHAKSYRQHHLPYTS